MRKWKTPLLCLACIILLTIGTIASIRHRGEMSYEAQVKRMKAKGEPLTMGELLGPPIPVDRNAAIVYEQAFQEYNRIRRPDDFIVIKDFLANLNGNKISSDLRAKVGEIIRRYDRVLYLTGVAAEMPECRFPIDWSRGWNTDLPHHGRLRQIFDLLYTKSVICALDGRSTEAIGCLGQVFSIADSLRREPHIQSQRARLLLLIHRACLASRDVTQYGNLDEMGLRRLMELVDSTDPDAGYEDAFRREKILVVSGCYDTLARDMTMCDCYPQSDSFLDRVSDLPSDVYLDTSARFHDTVQLRGDLALTLSLLDREMQSRDLSFSELKAAGLLDEPKLPSYAVVSSMIASNGIIQFERYRCRAELAGTQIMLALEIYHKRYRRYPSSLAELEHALRLELPKDPFSRKSFVYTRQGNGYRFYSIGVDMKDNGGTPPKSDDANAPGDYVWER